MSLNQKKTPIVTRNLGDGLQSQNFDIHDMSLITQHTALSKASGFFIKDIREKTPDFSRGMNHGVAMLFLEIIEFIRCVVHIEVIICLGKSIRKICFRSILALVGIEKCGKAATLNIAKRMIRVFSI